MTDPDAILRDLHWKAMALLDGDRDNPHFDNALGRFALAAIDRKLAADPDLAQRLADERWIEAHKPKFPTHYPTPDPEEDPAS